MNKFVTDHIDEIRNLKIENDFLKKVISEMICNQLREAKIPFNGTDEWVNSIIDTNDKLKDFGLGIQVDFCTQKDADGEIYNQELCVSVNNYPTAMDDLYNQIDQFLGSKE